MGGLGGGCRGGFAGAEKRGKAGRLLLGSSGAGMLGSAFGGASGAVGRSGICARDIKLSPRWVIPDGGWLDTISGAIACGRLRQIFPPDCMHVCFPAQVQHRLCTEPPTNAATEALPCLNPARRPSASLEP